MSQKIFHRLALLTAAGTLALGVSACGGSDDAEAPVAEYAVADTDLDPASRCARDGDTFVLEATVRNGADHAASYIVTATVQSTEDRDYRGTGTSDTVTVQAGETTDVTLDGFGDDAPKGATCTITASKKQAD